MGQLHYFPSNASLAPHLVLEELGVPYELVLVDRTRDAHKSPGYLALNPNGLIPVWVEGDLVLYESAAITLHLVDSHPERGLAPAVGSPERAHAYKWLLWLAASVQPQLVAYFYPERSAGGDASAQVKATAEARVGTLLDQLEAEFERHGGPWLLGARYSAVDAHAFMLCRWTRGFAHPARARPRLGSYLQRMLERPALQRVLAQEQLAPPWV